jgi:FkbM family methyltransferase
MAWCFAGGSYYELNVTAWITALAQGRVVYDVGANYGVHTLEAAAVADAVYAFEPVSDTRTVLERNVRRNDLAHVRILGCALSDAAGLQEMKLYNSSGNNSLWNRDLPPDHPLRQLGTETVELATLDGVAGESGLRPPGLLKIDVEGAELAVLRGARRTLARFLPFIVMEYSETTSRDAGYRREDLVDELRGLGYEVFGLAEDETDVKPYPLELWSGRAIANILAVPPGSALPVLGAEPTPVPPLPG